VHLIQEVLNRVSVHRAGNTRDERDAPVAYFEKLCLFGRFEL
jgi:hypothetical protein